MKLIIINGPNLNLLGEREIELFQALSPQLSLAKKFIDQSRDKMELIRMDKFKSSDKG